MGRCWDKIKNRISLPASKSRLSQPQPRSSLSRRLRRSGMAPMPPMFLRPQGA